MSRNFFENGGLIDHDKANIDRDQVLQYLEQRFGPEFMNIDDLRISLFGRIYTYGLLQDTNNEPNNKRLQNRHITDAREGELDLLGIYPVAINNRDVIHQLVFVKWDNDTLPSVLLENPSVKVDVNTIFDVFNDRQTRVCNQMQYVSTVICE